MTLFDTGTVFVNPNHLLSTDPTSFVALSYVGVAPRTTFDRRIGAWQETDVHVLNASFSDSTTVEVRVNLEFSSSNDAIDQALYYMESIGRASTDIRAGLDTITIHGGDYGYGGGSRDLLIHTGRTDSFVALGVLEEAIIHELAHITIDHIEINIEPEAAYIAAQTADGTFPSPYAEEFPLREDRAESFSLYYVLRKYPDRLTDAERQVILEGMPNRIDYFDGLDIGFDIADGNINVADLATDQADYLIAPENSAEINGAGGADTIFGGRANDIIRGGTGADLISGGDGADMLFASLDITDTGTDDIAVFAGSASQYDIVGGQRYTVVTDNAGQRDKLFGFDVLRFDDQDIVLNASSALDGAGDPTDFITAERVALLYEAALNRDGNIDLPGLNFYISVTERDGLTDEFLARDLMTSSEFTANFGDVETLSNSDFLEQIYLNVLDRTSDVAGRQFYLDLLDAGTISKALALADIAISPENTIESVTVLMELFETGSGGWAFI